MRWLGRTGNVAGTVDGKLRVTGLEKRYGGRSVVDNVSLTVRPAEIVGLLGPNGSGKTVTFSLISGLIKPDRGTVQLNGEDVTGMPMHERARRGLAYLPQERSVFRNLTTLDNIAAVVEIHGASKRDARDAARPCIPKSVAISLAQPSHCRDWRRQTRTSRSWTSPQQYSRNSAHTSRRCRPQPSPCESRGHTLGRQTPDAGVGHLSGATGTTPDSDGLPGLTCSAQSTEPTSPPLIPSRSRRAART